MKSMLMVAYHFPPVRGSSGLQRTLKFCKYLPQQGWMPNVLTVRPYVYPEITSDLIENIPAEIQVTRAFALDAARHLSIFGRYPSFIALPDRWSSWVVGGFASGVNVIRKCRPDVIWSTYPIATAHLIAFLLHKTFGLPWIVDIRDPMVESDYPTDRVLRRTLTWIEQMAVEAASKVIVTTDGTARLYRERYPAKAGRIECIPNGFDEDDFQLVEESIAKMGKLMTATDRPLTLLHSGIVYLSERDPRQFFEALRSLIDTGKLRREDLNVKFRACRNEAALQALLYKFKLEDVVHILPHLSYEQALKEMYDADGLLLLQGANCNEQVPAKAFEYMRTGKPILALTDPAGDTARIIKQSGVDSIAPLDNSDLIAELLGSFLDGLRHGTASHPSLEFAKGFSRENQGRQLTGILNGVISEERRR